jgi:hypothetical protein
MDKSKRITKKELLKFDLHKIKNRHVTEILDEIDKSIQNANACGMDSCVYNAPETFTEITNASLNRSLQLHIYFDLIKDLESRGFNVLIIKKTKQWNISWISDDDLHDIPSNISEYVIDHISV